MSDQSESIQQWRTIQYIHPLDPPNDTVGLNVRWAFLMQIYEAATNMQWLIYTDIRMSVITNKQMMTSGSSFE